MRKTKGFGLVSVILIIIITAIVSSVATGVIMLNNRDITNQNNLTDDENLLEFIEVYNTLVSKYYDEIDTEGMLNAAEEGMLNYLGDKYTTYLNGSEYDEIIDELSGTYKGIGVSVRANVIISITEGGPAEEAGLQVGDIILTIDGTDVTNMTSNDLSSLIKNSTNDTVTLDIKRNDETLNFIIKLEELPTINSTVLDNTTIGYIYIENFSENLDEQVREALEKLESMGITSLIIDLRDNVGGYLSSAETTSSLFLSEGKTIYSLESSGSTYTYKDETKEKRDYPIVVLINGSTASAAEIMAAALKESYGATIVGTKSYGKGKVQQVISLNSGDSVKYTSAKWLTPNGDCIDGIGIIPDYVVLYENSELYDSQVTKAIELLS